MSHLRFPLPEWDALPKGVKLRVVLLGFIIIALVVVHFVMRTPVSDPSAQPTSNSRISDPPSPVTSPEKTSPTFRSYEMEYEENMKSLLEAMLGPGNVHVFVTVDSSEETVWETHVSSKRTAVEERDAQGGTRTTGEENHEEEPVFLRSGDREYPVTRKVLKPRIRGVVVVARGAEDGRIKLWIVEAVGRAFDVPAHRIAVVPMRTTAP